MRNKEYKNSDVKVVHKDIFELKKADLAGFDAVISAFAAWTPETFGLHKKVAKHLADALSGTKTRLLVIGGDNLILNSKNESYISYADLALVVIDELKNGAFVQKRFTAVGERA